MDEKNPKQERKKAPQYEDVVMKTLLQYFAEEMFPYFGIEGKVVRMAPTELVELEIHKLYQDSNLIMDDGSWKHIEFQSRDGGVPDLKRFRAYEAGASYQNRVEITTYVLYSGKIKNPVTEFTEGINTYRVIPITLSNMDGDALLDTLKRKAEAGESLERRELIPMALCPLLGGEMELADRIRTAYQITGQTTCLSTEEKDKIEAVLYAMAEKFLESVDLEQIKEMIRMTRLGQMLLDEGMEKGIVKGCEITKLKNAESLLDILPEDIIAERLELPLETVKKLKNKN